MTSPPVAATAEDVTEELVTKLCLTALDHGILIGPRPMRAIIDRFIAELARDALAPKPMPPWDELKP